MAKEVRVDIRPLAALNGVQRQGGRGPIGGIERFQEGQRRLPQRIRVHGPARGTRHHQRRVSMRPSGAAAFCAIGFSP